MQNWKGVWEEAVGINGKNSVSAELRTMHEDICWSGGNPWYKLQ
jgi:hypothetical protein